MITCFEWITDLKHVYNQGSSAFIAGESIASCPYQNVFDTDDYIDSSSIRWSTWISGYNNAMHCNAKAMYAI